MEIAGVYHNSIHSSLGRSPIEVWKEAVSERKSMIDNRRIPNNKLLGGEWPVDLIERGETERVLQIIAQLKDGAYA